MAAPITTGFSIIICTHNGKNRLRPTLAHIAAVKVPEGKAVEVIVVNNASTDDTVAFVQEVWMKLGTPFPLHGVDENRLGLSFARQAGVARAAYDLILFCDDDNWLEPDYLQQALEIMQQDGRIGILGGLSTAVADKELPVWFKEFEHGYACGPQAEGDGEISDRMYITGAGMVIRKKIFDLLKEMHYKFQLSDRKGEELSSGGDVEISLVTAIIGYKLWYSSRLRLYHYIDAKRLTWKYLVKLIKGHTQSFYKLMFYLDIYNGKEYSKSWWKGLLQRSGFFLNRRGPLMVYHYLKNKYTVTDGFSLTKIAELEMWKTHWKMRSSYPEFIASLERFQKSVKELRLRQ